MGEGTGALGKGKVGCESSACSGVYPGGEGAGEDGGEGFGP